MRQYTGLEVAIIGLSGRFPGAGNVESFWSNLKNGVESIRHFTAEELAGEGIAAELISDPSYVRASSYMEDKKYFDAAFFNYRPDEATLMDPQMRLFHECVWAALEDACCDPDDPANKIGLFAGASGNINWAAYAALLNRKGLVDSFSASQLSEVRFMATRISYLLNVLRHNVF